MIRSDMKSIKEYFESLNKPSTSIPKDDVDADAVHENDDDNESRATEKEKMKAKIDAFEALMMDSKGDTHKKTPRKSLKRIGNASAKNKSS